MLIHWLDLGVYDDESEYQNSEVVKVGRQGWEAEQGSGGRLESYGAGVSVMSE